MTTVAISQLPQATTTSGTDDYPLVQGGITKRITFTNLFANATGVPIIAGTTGTLSVARGGTGATVATGTGNVVLATSPSLTTPTLTTPTISAATFTGTQTFNGPIASAAQALSGAGAVNITELTTKFTSTAAGNALTLANGVEGQIKVIVYVAETAGGDTGILTPANLGAGTTITFNTVGDACILQYLGTDWWAVSLRGAVLA